MKNDSNGKIKTRKEVVHSKCKDCGAEFVITSIEIKFANEDKGFTLPKRCPACREYRKNATKMVTCKDCGNIFEITAHEQKFYSERGLVEPKRCGECRKSRKVNGESNGEGQAEENKS